jgi:hypothetical protein
VAVEICHSDVRAGSQAGASAFAPASYAAAVASDGHQPPGARANGVVPALSPGDPSHIRAPGPSTELGQTGALFGSVLQAVRWRGSMHGGGCLLLPCAFSMQE